MYIYIYRYIYIYTVYAVSVYVWKTELISFCLLQTKNGNGKLPFVSENGERTINGNRRLLYQQTCPSTLPTSLHNLICGLLFKICSNTRNSKYFSDEKNTTTLRKRGLHCTVHRNTHIAVKSKRYPLESCRVREIHHGTVGNEEGYMLTLRYPFHSLHF